MNNNDNLGTSNLLNFELSIYRLNNKRSLKKKKHYCSWIEKERVKKK
jgi:hypothetical protein